MALTLTDPATSTDLPLWSAQSLSNDRSAQVETSPPPGSDSDEAFITALTQDGQATIQGAATAPRLVRSNNWPNNPIEALADWAATFEAFVNGGQGGGYTLSRDYRNDSFDGYVTTAQWTRRGGEPWELGFTLEFVRGDGFGVDNTLSVASTSPGGSYTVAGQTISHIREFQVQKSQPVNVTRRTYATSPDENDLTSDEGASRSITVVGDIEGDAATRNSFDSTIAGDLGQDNIITVDDAFTGRSYEGMIDSYEATDEAGRFRLGEFGITVIEGSR